MNKDNYFYCLARHESCDRDMFGKVACDTCKTNGDCRVCGRFQTTFCDKCAQRTDVSDKALAMPDK